MNMITSIVLKVTNKCNLNCKYCYVYNQGDKSYFYDDPFLKEETAITLIKRIKEHVDKYKLKEFLIIFHGGEPLLLGENFFINFVKQTQKIISATKILFAVQTNGVLLTKHFIETLNRLDIHIGVSLDGTENSNKLRIYRKNNLPAYKDILIGVQNLIKYGKSGANLLSVINVEEEPLKVYEFYKDLGIKTVSFLFPTWNHDMSKKDEVPKLGEWLIRMFKVWNSDKKDKITIRPFDFLIFKILGYENISNEYFGRNVNDVITIKSSGSIEAVDSLRVCEDGFTRTNLNIYKNALDDAFKDSLYHKYYYAHSTEQLCDTCLVCDILDICGGGLLAHRYSRDRGFNNVSVYCTEIKKLISYIQNDILSKMTPSLVNELNLEKYRI